MSETIHKECAETVLDAMSEKPRDPGPTLVIVHELLRASGAVRKEDRVSEKPVAEPEKAKSTRKSKAADATAE